MVDELGDERASAAQRLLPEWEDDTQRLIFQVRPRMPMRLQQPLKLYTYGMHIVDAHWIQKTLASFDIEVDVQVLDYHLFADPNNWLDADLVLSGEVLDENLEMALYEWFATQRSQGTVWATNNAISSMKNYALHWHCQVRTCAWTPLEKWTFTYSKS